MTVALIASLLANAFLVWLALALCRASLFWQRAYNNLHSLFMGQLRSDHSRHQAELRDTLARIRGRREKREWN